MKNDSNSLEIALALRGGGIPLNMVFGFVQYVKEKDKMKGRRKYAAYYRKKGDRLWIRVHGDIAGSKDAIVRSYQSWLLAQPADEERAIRPLGKTRNA